MFSPTSIADFIACKHLAALNRAATAGEIERPYFSDPGLELLNHESISNMMNDLRCFTILPPLLQHSTPESDGTRSSINRDRRKSKIRFNKPASSA